jgi:hypothetical protein
LLFIALKASNFQSKAIRGCSERMVGEMSVTLGRCCRRVPKQSPNDLQAKATRSEMGCISVPIVVSAIVGDARPLHDGAPNALSEAE